MSVNTENAFIVLLCVIVCGVFAVIIASSGNGAFMEAIWYLMPVGLLVAVGWIVWALLRDAVTAGVKKASPADRLAIAQPPAAPPLGDTKACPFCAETIKAAAVVCRFCNRQLSADLDREKQNNRNPIPPKPDVIAVRRFRVAGRDRSGRPVTLTVAARSPVDAAKAAAARGLTVQTCEPVGESAIV